MLPTRALPATQYSPGAFRCSDHWPWGEKPSLWKASDLTEEAFAFGEFRTYQVQIAKIEAATGLDFGLLRDVDVPGPGAAAEALDLPHARLITDPGDLIL